MDASSLNGLYAITAPELTADLIAACEQALMGGVKLLQYRHKKADAATRFMQCRTLLPLCHRYGAKLIVNDEAILANAVGADGVHLGQHGGSVEAARELLGEDKIIGVSCLNSLQLVQQAIDEGVNYVSLGRFFASHTKPDADAADLSIIQQATTLGIPLVAVGGITLDNAPQVLRAGAKTLAVAHGLFGQADITQAACQFAELFED